MGSAASPQIKYHRQRMQARARAIAWEFTFESWWAVWENSGKWEQRGRGSNEYVMARNGDAGPYSTNNVRIVTVLENLLERVANGHSCLGKGRGWKLDRRCTTRPYEVRVAGRAVGSFATQEEAEAAYKSAAIRRLQELRA